MGAFDIHLSHWSVGDGPRLTFTSGADVVLVSHQSSSDAAALFVDPQLALQALDGIVATLLQQTAQGYMPDFIRTCTSRSTSETCSFYVDTEAFTFHASFPCLELGDTLLLGIHDELQVINIEKLPWHPSMELTWQLALPAPGWRVVG